MNTAEDWATLSKEIKLMTSDYQNALAFWLSATRGTKKKKLTSLPHWPETEKVNNKTVLLKAGKSIWRDFYTGQRLDNTTELFLDTEVEAIYRDKNNCLAARYIGANLWNTSRNVVLPSALTGFYRTRVRSRSLAMLVTLLPD